MADRDDVRAIALGLEGTSEAPHHKRIAYKAGRIYATVDAAGETVNLGLSPDEQAMKVEMASGVFSAVSGAWGAGGWTQVRLASISLPELEQVLRMAWERARRKG